MTQRRSLKDDLDYNDGLGDMLREREHEEFSWVKTSISAVSIVIAALIVFIIGFQFAKYSIAKKAEKTVKTHHEVTKIDTSEEIDSEIAKIEAQNNQLTRSATESISMDGIPTVTTTPSRSAPQPALAPVAPVSPPSPKVVQATPAPPPSSERSYKVIAGSYSTRENAQARAIELANKRLASFIWTDTVAGRSIYRVQVGAYPSQMSAEAAVTDFQRVGISASVIRKSN